MKYLLIVSFNPSLSNLYIFKSSFLDATSKNLSGKAWILTGLYISLSDINSNTLDSNVKLGVRKIENDTIIDTVTGILINDISLKKSRDYITI